MERVRSPGAVESSFDPVLLAVLANRFDMIVREMTNTLLRTSRSSVLNSGRDFSCAIVTADDQLLAAAEGLPVHIFGAHLQTAAMRQRGDLARGDAFLDNDPYVGGTHHADHTILVPVFGGGGHAFTVCTKGHQADIGNAQPSVYAPAARDLYEEGALNFPCVQVQRDYADVDDVIRMCRRRIRVPDQWYGDYLAMLGAARIGERRLEELVAMYGREVIDDFISAWFDYSERRIGAAIGRMSSGRVSGHGQHDPIDVLPGGVPINVSVELDADRGRVTVDLRDNVDSVPAGLNLSRACSTNSALVAVFNVLGKDIPRNAGSFRRADVRLREGCVVGIAEHPTCCSMATTNIADRVVNIAQSALADISPHVGIAEGGGAIGPGYAVVSGTDPRYGEAAYVLELMLANNGGPASSYQDGWLTWGEPVVAGLLYRDSVEIIEQKAPLLVRSLRLVPDSGGPGRHRGAPALQVTYGPTHNAMTVMYGPIDGHATPPRGVRGGQAGGWGHAEKLTADGTAQPLPPVDALTLVPGEFVVGTDCGGGGYGSPHEREPSKVLRDVLTGLVTPGAARDIYGVLIDVASDGLTVAIDCDATLDLRSRSNPTGGDGNGDVGPREEKA